LAAKHHLAAAEADEENDLTGAAAHAYIAYGHQLRAVGYSEIAAEDDVLTDIEMVEEDRPRNTAASFLFSDKFLIRKQADPEETLIGLFCDLVPLVSCP